MVYRCTADQRLSVRSLIGIEEELGYEMVPIGKDENKNQWHYELNTKNLDKQQLIFLTDSGLTDIAQSQPKCIEDGEPITKVFAYAKGTFDNLPNRDDYSEFEPIPPRKGPFRH